MLIRNLLEIWWGSQRGDPSRLIEHNIKRLQRKANAYDWECLWDSRQWTSSKSRVWSSNTDIIKMYLKPFLTVNCIEKSRNDPYNFLFCLRQNQKISINNCIVKNNLLGWGLVVMGGDSCSKGCGFESQNHLLNGYFSHICWTNCNDVCLKTSKINYIRGLGGPF